MTEYEYIKELYGLAIDDKNIWCKCPFIKTNFIQYNGVIKSIKTFLHTLSVIYFLF